MGQCHWPQFEKYCGLCSLRSGIYLKSIINLIVLIGLVISNTIQLIHVVDFGWVLYSDDLMEIRRRLGHDLSEFEVEIMRDIHKTFIALYIMWLVFKTMYIIIIFCTVWAICKRKAKFLRVLFYVNIPNWVFDLLVTVVSSILADHALIVIMHITVLAEAYNLFAIWSEYKRIAKKSDLLSQNFGLGRSINICPNGFVNPPHRELTFPSDRHEIHCGTCTCNLTPILQNIPITAQPQALNLDLIVNTPGPSEPVAKELNFKEEPIIFNQNLLVEQRSAIINDIDGDDASAQMCNTCKEKKLDIAEIPVIYDETQLNVGSSPIIEDRGIHF